MSARKNAPRKPGRGRPKTTGRGHLIGVRAHADFLAALDRWRAAQPVPPSRPAAIVYLAKIGLGRPR